MTHIGESFLLRQVPLGGSPLSRAAQSGRVDPAWYPPRPVGRAGWSARAAELAATFPDGRWYQVLAPAFAATGQARSRLERAAAGGLVVTTGQQPGLFGGPMYTWTKAMSALAMADALEASLGVPVAPVFWAATDDADWVEACSTAFGTSRGLLSLRLAGPATEGRPMADVPLGEVDSVLALLDQACGSAAHAEIRALVRRAYVPQATVGAAYVQLLRGLLEPCGIAVLDSAHAAVREAADPLLRRALRVADPIHHALKARQDAIEAAGFTPQVDVVEELSLVFHTTTQASTDGGGVVRVRERVPRTSASGVAREAVAGSLGANVLLRPVLEQAILPTACYLAGPGEYAYFAQVSAVAAALEVAPPLPIPRVAVEVVPSDVPARLEALGLVEADLAGPHGAEQVVARQRLSEMMADAIERLRVTVETQVGALRESGPSDRSVVADEVVQGLASDLEARIARFERRVLAGVKRREDGLMQEVAALRAILRPQGQSPERVLNLVPWLVRYGPALLDAIAAEIRPHVRGLVDGDPPAA